MGSEFKNAMAKTYMYKVITIVMTTNSLSRVNKPLLLNFTFSTSQCKHFFTGNLTTAT